MVYRVPVATYRLQFHAGFTLEDARRIVPYLAELGITDLYASPLLRPRTGSTHGYDIVDPHTLNPALGTPEDFAALHEELARRDMGLLLDIVPNHMAASHENAWWMSVLENGAQSRYLHYFDIDWRPFASQSGRMEDKVLLPILGRPYGEVLEAQEIKLGFDAEGLFFSYWDKRLPLAPQSYQLVLRQCADALPSEGAGIEVHDLIANDNVIANSRFLKDTLWRLYEQSEAFRTALDEAIQRYNGVAGDADSFNDLDRLLDAQWYRLAYWRIAAETINYRRFFDVTDLVGLRIENPEVFEARNKIVLEWLSEGKITGVRIDHIDGLYDPVNYLTKLQLRLGDPATDIVEEFYVVVEKILAEGEVLPEQFLVAGTTGYDFLDSVNAVFVDPEGLRRLTDFYVKFTGLTTPFEDLVYERKRQVIHDLFAGEMRALAMHLAHLGIGDRNARDFSPSDLQTVLLEVTACMPVYRTYVREAPVSDADRAILGRGLAEARRRAGSSVEPRVFAFVERVLLLQPPSYLEEERDAWLAFVMRWQQFTGRVMAKGVEDTAFYNFNRLISLNEVGGEPGRGFEFDPVAELHERNERIAEAWPHTMNATSTHDTKRAEDVRARISVLSEVPDEWARHVKKWSSLNAPLKQNGAPDANEELLIYQTLIGAWPVDEERIRGVIEKSLREAKTHSSWLEPDAQYEKSVQDFAVALLTHKPFVDSFTRFHKRIALHGALNSLSQVVLKACSPGLPDFYQGTELWDYSLVDPDNRRPVDYDQRVMALASLRSAQPARLLSRCADGTVKLFVTARTLALRAKHRETFRGGSYRAIEAGPNCVAFLRGDDVLVVVPRLTTQLVKGAKFPLGDAWGDRTLALHGSWKNVFTGEMVEGDALALREIFATFPVAVLERA